MKRSPRLTFRWSVAAVVIAALFSASICGLVFVSALHAATTHNGYGNVVVPSISGTPQGGQTLTADPGTWNSNGTGPVTYTYQWERCSPNNLVSNSGFETDTSGWTPVSTGSKSVTISRVSTPVHSGSGALKVVLPGSGLGEGATNTTSIPIDATQRFHISAWVQAPPDSSSTAYSSQLFVEAQFYDGNGTALSQAQPSQQQWSTGGVWTLLNGTITAPAGAASATVAVKNYSKFNATVYADDVWLNTCTAIDGATGQAYDAGPSDVGNRLVVDIFAHYATGYVYDYYSDETAPIADYPSDGSGGATGDTQSNPDYTQLEAEADPEPNNPAPPAVSGWDATGATPNVIPCCDGGGGVTVDRSAIVAYAEKYVGILGTDLNTGWNSAYPAYGNDCQNFVSQALHAGGWPFDTAAGGPWYLPDVWAYYDSIDHSWSWTVSSYFWRYVGEHATNRASFVSYWSQLQPGDVVFVDWYGQKHYPTHTMLVTERTTNPTTGQVDLGLTYHTRNRLNESLRTLIRDFPNATWWAIHLNDSF